MHYTAGRFPTMPGILPFGYDSTMALNIKDDETERLASEIAAWTGESKTGAIRTALRERRERLALQRAAGDRERALRAVLEEEIWPKVPAAMIGHGPSSEEQEAILGYGPQGF
jgi:antitoxin VapB